MSRTLRTIQLGLLAATLTLGGVALGQDGHEGHDHPPGEHPTEPAQPAKPAEKFVEPVNAQLELVAVAKRAEVAVGEMVEVTVTLKNTGVDAVKLPKLAEDRQLVSFDVQLDDGKVFPFQRITPSPYAAKKDWETATLAPVGTWNLTVPFAAVTAGKLTITAHYGRVTAAGLNPKPPAVVSKPVQIKIVPAKNGAKDVRIRLITTMGPIDLRLFPREALGTSLHYARMILEGGKTQGKGDVRKPFYKGLGFHRVIPNFMIQGGCPLGTGTGDAGYAIPAEIATKGADGKVPEKLRHVPGRLAMAKTSHPDSAGTQFYICTGTPTHLDGGYTVFGEVTRGLDVAMTIAEVPADQNNKPTKPMKIESIRLEPQPK